MSNMYVEVFKDTIKDFYKKHEELNAKITENNEYYAPEYAKKENAKIREQQVQLYESARADINNTFAEARELLSNASFLNVEQLTADRLLFSPDSAFDLSAAEVRAYVERYENNFTMLRLIKDWITKQEKSNNGKISEYADIRINLPSDMVKAYKTFADGALKIIDRVHNDPDHTGADIDAYANESFASDLYAVIGNGLNLSDYKTRKVPDTAKHLFDNVKLSTASEYSDIYVGETA